MGEGIVIREYTSSVGQEFFISIEDNLGYLYGFTRLLLPKEDETIEEDLILVLTDNEPLDQQVVEKLTNLENEHQLFFKPLKMKMQQEVDITWPDDSSSKILIKFPGILIGQSRNKYLLLYFNDHRWFDLTKRYLSK
mgnify:CR=1 FL=1